MVPNGWKKGVIEDIAKVSSGGTPSRQNDSYWLDGQIPWVTTTEVQFGVINDTEQKITEAGLKNSSAKLFPIDTILLAMYGQGKTRGQVAKLGIEASTNQACAALLLNDGFEVDYYYQYLVSQYENIRELANSGGQQNLSAGIIKGIHVPIPPQLEQRKIAKTLSTWDQAISNIERLIDNSKQQKKALMQQLFTGKKRLLDDSGKPFEGDYNRVNLSELATIDKSSLGKKTPEDFEFSYISLSDVETGKIAGNLEKHFFAPSPSRARRKVSCGDILLATVRPNLKGFAKVKAEHDGMIASTGFSVLTPKKGVSGDYLYHYLFSCHITGQINALVVGSNYPAINSSDVSGLKVYIPCYDEQKKIAKVLNNADESLAQLEQQLADLKQEKKALMQQLLTGKRRVKVDNTEAA